MSKGDLFERKVRQFSAVRFGLPFQQEHLSGINFDCVANRRDDYKIIIEATVNHTLEKIRGDVVRLQLVKQKLLGEGIFAEVYIVLEKEPTTSMIESARAARIEITSFELFYRNWYDSSSYIAARLQRSFGSAINEAQEGPDTRPYVPVFFDDRNGHRYKLEDLVTRIQHGARIVMIGDFGTGKSRCIQELFSKLIPKTATEKSPISIDLRTMWGTQSAEELIYRHYSMLQLDAMKERAVEALHKGDLFLLLDGFDELAIQEWGSEPDAIAKSRARTMEPIRDILNRTKSGAIICGREHYFSSDNEMLAALGLNRNSIIVETPPEFSMEEAKKFLHTAGYDGHIPIWLPRKPLIAEMYANFSQKKLIDAGSGRPEFWESFIDALCRRDSQIRASYDPETIKNILRLLSRKTRTTPDGRGPITPTDVQQAFTSIVGQHPAQEAISMLQRLPGLGRVAAETDDRQFIDDFIAEGLRGFDVSSIVSTFEVNIDSSEWKHGAGDLGLEIIANRINKSFTIIDAVKRIQNGRGKNEGPLNCDIIGGIALSPVSEIDISGSEICGGYISTFDLSEKAIEGLHLSGCEIGYLNIFNSNTIDTIISDSIIETLDGVSGSEVPDWIKNCEIEKKSNLDTVARIRKTHLKPSEIILVTILRKTFFQPGSGRKEEALLRGLGEYGDAKLQGKVLRTLVSSEFLQEANGRSGKLYVPERSKTSRASKMMSQLQQSNDPIWLEVSQF
ncbi:NACHT domain-containing protein [Gluconobacter sphaericus]|uniref:hypothetical protein n=1 Tax=Gluconobacter sphaericus TaxID=574987 RepID=UPI001B8BE42C|nr:hypothetical protein [Gluconobacter sphaericus]MBS1087210.1 hypothetical protein [Gluconobacter sphaericus]MBS1101256.1 hypothetical protein [Gluconobacter sphaericus]